MQPSVFWADEPPPVPVALVETPGTGVTDYLLLGRWHSCWLHWLGRRSLPCYGDACPRSRHHRPVRWCGYAPAARAVHPKDNKKKIIGWHRLVLPIGLECAHDLKPHLVRFPGLCLRVTRSAGSKAWKWEVISLTSVPTGLPEPFDVSPTLYRLWGIMPPTITEDAP